MKVVSKVKYKEEQIKALEELGYEIIIRTGQLEEEDYDCEVLHCYDYYTDKNADKFTNLKLIQLESIGFEHIPQDKVNEKNIIVANQKGIYSKPIGEWIVFNILEIIKNAKKLYENQKIKKWEFISGIDELEGKILLFLGTGTISIEAVKRLSNFGVKLIGLNTNGRHIDGFDECHKLSEIDEYSKNADFIINVLPATDKTTNFLNKSAMSNFKKGVNFINVSRGAVVNQDDLIEALVDGTIKTACLDVFDVEPLDTSSAFWDMDNVYLTPHISWNSYKKRDRVYETLYTNLKKFVENKELINVVDLKKGY